MAIPTLQEILNLVPEELKPLAGDVLPVLLAWAIEDLQKVRDWVTLAINDSDAAFRQALDGMTDEQLDALDLADLAKQEADAGANAERADQRKRMFVSVMLTLAGILLGAIA
jgi:hypothetical protein